MPIEIVVVIMKSITSANFTVGYLKLVGNRSTITQYTVLMPSDVNASNMQDSTKFCVEFCTKYSPIVTAPATTRLNTAFQSVEREMK